MWRNLQYSGALYRLTSVKGLPPEPIVLGACRPELDAEGGPRATMSAPTSSKECVPAHPR